MDFRALHFSDKLDVINPNATVGLTTLWSDRGYIRKKLQELGVDLNPQTSKIAVIGNLFGNGIPQMLRNLLYNPQITDIVLCGSDRSGSAAHLRAFFENGLDKSPSCGLPTTKIAGTSFVIDDAVTPDMFSGRVRIHGPFGDSNAAESQLLKVKGFLENHGCAGNDMELERVEVPMPEVKLDYFPSHPASHCIVMDSPLACWREVVFRIARFGHLSRLRKGDRKELQNLKVVITDPKEDEPEKLAEYGFDIEDFRNYQREMLESAIQDDQPYTYGNRIGAYFGFDSVDKLAQRLTANPQDRHCHLSLWDSRKDIDAEDSPCLVSVFFRFFDEKLTLAALYRTHNALDAWLENVYGLIALQKKVAEKASMECGAITVVSQSISIDPTRYEIAKKVCEKKGFEVNLDPNGYFTFTTDGDEIVAFHLNPDGQQINEYRGKKPEAIQHQLYRDCAISDIGHAIYIGRQLERAAECIRQGRVFEEE